jgi:fucose 4-O-acetylase-like acetyltransferase
MKQRIDFIDLAKGICISLVVLLHVYGDLSGAFIKVMNLFRMPLYFFLSGLFFKTYDGFIPFVKKKANKLLIPFLFTFFLLIIPSSLVLNNMEGRVISVYSLFWGNNGRLNLGINGASWFLLCLFAVNVYFYLIFLLARHHIWGVTIMSCLCGVAGYVMNLHGLYLPLWMDSAFTALPFFLMGYVLNHYGNLLYGKMGGRDLLYLCLSLLLLIGIYIVDEMMGTGCVAFGENIYDISIFSLYIGGFMGTYFVLMLSKYLKHVPGVSYLGRYSIVVLLTHLLYLFIIRNILYQVGIPQNSIVLNLFVFVFVLLLELPTIWFCIRYLPYWFAQKDLWR